MISLRKKSVRSKGWFSGHSAQGGREGGGGFLHVVVCGVLVVVCLCVACFSLIAGAAPIVLCGHEQALVSINLKNPVDAGVGRAFAVVIEGG